MDRCFLFLGGGSSVLRSRPIVFYATYVNYDLANHGFLTPLFIDSSAVHIMVDETFHDIAGNSPGALPATMRRSGLRI